MELRRILESAPNYGTPPEPGLIYDNLYLGTAGNAHNLQLLRRLGITHVYNCAGISSLRIQREERYGPESGVVEYNEIPCLDEEFYHISAHFTKAHMYIDHARQRGKLLVFCPDVNRSAPSVLAIWLGRVSPFSELLPIVKDKRKSVLYNKGFMQQLVVFARDHGCLKRSHSHLGASQFDGIGRVKDRHYQGHLSRPINTLTMVQHSMYLRYEVAWLYCVKEYLVP